MPKKTAEEVALTPVKKVPRFTHVWNNIAEKSGLAVTTGLNPDGYLMLEWRGTQEQMRATGLLTECYTFPHPGGRVAFHNAQIGGYMNTLEDGRVIAQIDCCNKPLSIEHKDGVEIIKFDEEIYYHGDRSALTSIGVCDESCFPKGKRLTRKIGGWGNEKWLSIKRLPDATYLVITDTEEAFQARRRECEEWEKENLHGKQKDEPLTADAFKTFCMNQIKSSLFASLVDAGYMSSSENRPFCFPDDIHTKALTKIHEIISLYENCPIIKRRAPINHERIKSATAAQTDATFQRFMKNLQASGHGH